MWRRSNLPGNPDSDQSISEEDEEHVDDEMLCPSDKGRGLLLQTKLDKLIGGCVGELNYAEEATPRKLSSSLEEVVPDSPPEECYFDSSSTRDGLTCISSAHETVPDDEMVCDEPVATWSTISKEAKSLLHLNGIAPLISSSHSSALKAKRGTKVVKDNVRPKFSFHSHTHGETSSKISDMTEYLELADDQAAIEEEEDPIAECPNSFDEILSDNTQDAVSKLLNPPPDMIRVTKRSSKSYSRRRHDGKCFKFAHKGSSTNIHDTTDDELPGPMDSGSSTDDDEPSYHQTSVPDQKKQFVGDLFNEAVKASSLNKEGHSFDSPKLSGGSSLYGKLQQIMKQEKEMEIEITKKLQGGMGQAADASSYVDIKIVSRHLEGKLVVCKCSVIDLPGDSLMFKNTQALAGKEDTEATVIFNPKVCVDVDIEIGSFVRVHAPWKEMEVKNSKEVIILCSYFSSL